MSELWTISVGGRVYGPYSAEQMRGFAAEGRLAATSLVAHHGEQNFRNAEDEPELAPLFHSARPGGLPELMDEQTPTFGRHGEGEQTGEFAHVTIIADMKSRSVTGLEEEIYNLGPAYTIMPQAWIVRTDIPINVIRNILMQKLGKLDVLFIVD